MENCGTEYIPTQWVNGTAPAINAVNLNHIENGIKDNADCIIELASAIEEIGIPSGMIVMWNGVSMPSGWVLCDGNNGTPNLLNKFVRGGTSSGHEGGNDNHSVIEHSHNVSVETGSFDLRNVDDNGNEHAIVGGGSGSVDIQSVTDTSDTRRVSLQPIDAVNAMRVSISPTAVAETTGVSGEGRNVPVYYMLMYIMKL